ncbi:MAG: MFS transporter [candidate division KSB1 bacterium]|nr:MFS transporter [candidate division KSB1 bacterium]MDZ7272583.1 MFS transporter [candidate division KSB1 bacterium]MDZ7284394.1 MFS transporter [candidate division KSB1 bacterium]MDZ7297210.1 MFS transporter [candidate division KSB1 bacterium]MDZ7309314.1 MFS transporter [candidate division KSB1 bacterium]
MTFLLRFGALRHRNYRLFFAGQFVSFLGTWMQNTAQGWLVYQLTHSPAWLGVISFLGFLPLSLFALIGGSLADRCNRRRLVLITNVLAMIIASLFAVLIWQQLIGIHLVAVLVFLNGVVNAFDIPARQSFLVEMVGKEDLANGIALNSAMFNGARMIGPAIGGLVIAAFGTAWCMAANALSFLATVLAVAAIRTVAPIRAQQAPLRLLQSLREGAAYIRSSQLVWGVLGLVAVSTVFGWSYTVILPVYADKILGGGAVELGQLLSASGLGALGGAVFSATLGSRWRPRQILLAGLVIFTLAITTFALARQPLFATLCVALMGLGLILFNVNSNTALQQRVPDHLRGRVMGFYVLCFGGLMPVGSLQIGFVAEKLDVTLALLFNAVICGLAVLAALRVLVQMRQRPLDEAAAASPSPINAFSIER